MQPGKYTWVGLAYSRKRSSTHGRARFKQRWQSKKSSIMEAATAFKDYVDESFPVEAKRTRSAIIRRSYADRIVSFLKDGTNESDKNFRHLVKRSGFQLLDLPEAGLRDVLVVKVSEEKQVSCLNMCGVCVKST